MAKPTYISLMRQFARFDKAAQERPFAGNYTPEKADAIEDEYLKARNALTDALRRVTQ